ncbi:MAG: response regulator [Firmicutes bacterium]|nr:response regulator [Bacillota bacterium]MDD4693222.1 response regulator [Bacillota bacterium]
MTKVLVVDDASFMRMRMNKLLTENGYEVDEAENGLDALDKYQKDSYDLVIMDITMPAMDGIEAVKHIKDLDPEAKIIMCSAIGQQQMVIEALKAGAKDFVVKPFQPDRIMESIKRVLS